MNVMSVNSNVRALLIVDDDDAFRLALKHVISERGGYKVRSAGSGEEAIEALRQEEFDVIVLDYRLPGISGLNVLQWMHEQKSETPVIMMTGAGSEVIAVEAMKLGAYDYVRKDQIDIDHVGILVDGVVERHLFRKEKKLREAVERERDKVLVAMHTFHSTIASIAQIVNNSLSMVSLSIRRNEIRIKPFVLDQRQQQFTQVFRDLTQEYSVIASAVKSMLDMANVLHGNLTDDSHTDLHQDVKSGEPKHIKEGAAPESLPTKVNEKGNA